MFLRELVKGIRLASFVDRRMRQLFMFLKIVIVQGLLGILVNGVVEWTLERHQIFRSWLTFASTLRQFGPKVLTRISWRDSRAISFIVDGSSRMTSYIWEDLLWMVR